MHKINIKQGKIILEHPTSEEEREEMLNSYSEIEELINIEEIANNIDSNYDLICILPSINIIENIYESLFIFKLHDFSKLENGVEIGGNVIPTQALKIIPSNIKFPKELRDTVIIASISEDQSYSDLLTRDEIKYNFGLIPKYNSFDSLEDLIDSPDKISFKSVLGGYPSDDYPFEDEFKVETLIQIAEIIEDDIFPDFNSDTVYGIYYNTESKEFCGRVYGW